MQIRHVTIILAGWLAPMLLVAGCASSEPKLADPGPDPLRVGITPDYPPVVFKQDGQVVGIEADFARRLGERLGRPVRFVELSWDEQVSALLAGQTDIIMSGLSITPARQVRISFTQPYLKSGLLAMMRRGDAQRFASLTRIDARDVVVGAPRGTTADAFMQKRFSNARRIGLQSARDAPSLLMRHEIDVFIHDAPSVVWLVSENEATLTARWALLNQEQLAWGLRRGDQALLESANAALETWRQDGTLDEVLRYWLPYLDSLQEPRERPSDVAR